MDKSIGLRIRERRKDLKITGAEIKEKTGISTGNLSDIENGKSLPSALAIIQLSQVLQCSTDYILFGDIASSPSPAYLRNSDLRDSETQLLDQFRTLSADDQEEIFAMIQLKYSRRKLPKAEKQDKKSPKNPPHLQNPALN